MEFKIYSKGQWRQEEPKMMSQKNKICLTQDELQIAQPAQHAQPTESSSSSSVRCVGGRIVRPRQREKESPSTACNTSKVLIDTLGGAQLGSAAQPPCFGNPPGIPQVPSMPLPLLPSTTLASPQSTAQTYLREWRPLGAKPKSPSGTSFPGHDQKLAAQGQERWRN